MPTSAIIALSMSNLLIMNEIGWVEAEAALNGCIEGW